MKLIFREEPTIPGYIWYTVSSVGEVFSWYTGNPEKLAQYLTAEGYYNVQLISENKKTAQYVHRLVALTFLTPKPGQTMVNHKDGNKTNNNLKNLEWCTSSENALHRIENGIQVHHTRKVLQLDDDGKILCKYESITAAAEKTGISIGNISVVCGYFNGNPRGTAGGFYWVFEEDYNGKPPDKTNKSAKRVAQYSKSGEYIATYESVKAAAVAIGCNQSGVSAVITGRAKTAKGYIFKIVEIPKIVNMAFLKLDKLTAKWKAHPDFPKYKISRSGKVYSLHQHKFLKPGKRAGRLHICLRNNGIKGNFSIHRLVALLYIPNPNKYPVVNHKDGKPLNNKVTNLEWCTSSYNTQHAHDIGLNSRNKAVTRIDIRNGTQKYYTSITNAAKDAGFSSTTISKYIKSGNTKDSYQWKFTV